MKNSINPEIMKNLVTRFAPSPTGFLHIGNARTAIFNWLLAQHYGGKFYLRIEDTDRARFSQEAVDIIFESLAFLGLTYDNPATIIYQSQRTDRYHEVIQNLLNTNQAYKCFHTAEELEQLKAANLNQGFRSQWRDRTDHPDSPYTVRLKVPNHGATTFHDIVQGEVTVKNTDIEDFTLLRSDGSPTYMLAVVVDDHDMGVTQVLRGADHLTNTFKQLLLFQAMNCPAPHYGHIPLIHDIGGKKLSKRDGAIGVLDYAAQGILPQALFNYLMRLGWGHKDEEFITPERAKEIFTEKGLGKSAARFDPAKLWDLNSKWIRYIPLDELLSRAKEYASKYMNVNYDEQGWDRLHKGLESVRIRARTLKDLVESGIVYLQEDLSSKCELEAFEHITQLEQFLLTADYSTNLEEQFREFCTLNNIEFKQAAPWLRKKLTGQQVSPSLFDVMKTLGKDLCLRRLRTQ